MYYGGHNPKLKSVGEQCHESWKQLPSASKAVICARKKGLTKAEDALATASKEVKAGTDLMDPFELTGGRRQP